METPLKAIRAKCLDCCCGFANEVKLCTSEKCPLHPFRFGKNPFRVKREMTEEQREAARARLAQNIRLRNREKLENPTTEGNYTPATQTAAESHPAPYKESPLHQPTKT